MKMIKINRVVVGNNGENKMYGEVCINVDKIICIEDAPYKVDNAFECTHEDYEKLKKINPNSYFADIIVAYPDDVQSFIAVEPKDRIYSMINS